MPSVFTLERPELPGYWGPAHPIGSGLGTGALGEVTGAKLLGAGILGFLGGITAGLLLGGAVIFGMRRVRR